ncbi:hypothetical protein [Streptomyces sp. NPDC060002]|uniref:hypothetical protein n=1 Tax=Streptomyces sp. NPDC060002 TaxID=3347033 RepID=UPI0036934EC2
MTPPDDAFRAGAGRAAVDLTAGVLPVDGFAGVHDPPHARVAVRDDGQTRLALVRTAAHIRTAPFATPLRVIHTHVEVPAQKPPAGLHTLRPATSYPYEPDGTAQVPIVAVHLGVTALAGLQAELNAATGLAVKAASPFPHTCLVTMVNGAAKYMADAGGYDRVTYEAMNSRCARGAAETVAGRIDGLLRDPHTTDPPTTDPPTMDPHTPGPVSAPGRHRQRSEIRHTACGADAPVP